MLQCNKFYKMMVLNYTEADSPTNLTINNNVRVAVVVLFIRLFILRRRRRRRRHQHHRSPRDAYMREWASECVENTNFSHHNHEMLKNSANKRKRKRGQSCARPAYTQCVIRCSIEIGAKPFWAILQMTNELFHSWFALYSTS